MEVYEYYLIPELLKPLKNLLKQPLQLLLRKWELDDLRADRGRGSER